MTIERARTFFGLFTWSKPLNLKETYYFENQHSYLKDKLSTWVDLWKIHIRSQDIIDLEESTVNVLIRTRYGSIYSEPYLKIEKTLYGSEINKEKLEFSRFPGIKDKIIWKPME